MATPKETIWEIDPHTQAKHEILRRYLGAWFPILLSKRHNRVVYIDGFSGPGRYKNGELGSPIIALQEAMRLGSRLEGKNLSFLFMDARNDRIEHLKIVLI
jgi:three-Cys-motif partner protein